MKCSKCDLEIYVVSVHKLIAGLVQVNNGKAILNTFVQTMESSPHYSLFCIRCGHEIGDIIKLES